MPARHKIIPAAEHARFGAFLQKVRQEAGVSQRELAKRLNLPQSYISKIERGERQVQALELFRICEKIGVEVSSTVARFLTDERKPE